MPTFLGRAVLPGAVEGRALVTRQGFNTYASYFSSIHTRVRKAVCADSGNPDLFGRDLTAAIICLPGTTGSTSSGAVWQRLASWDLAPRAMLFSNKIDPLAAGGLIVADIWAGKRIVTVDCLGNDFLSAAQSNASIRVLASGVVIIDS